MTHAPILVLGAAGHTGRFVVAELARRGLSAVAAGRDAGKLAAAHPGVERRVVDLADPAALDRALAGCAAVIHCAGPFIDTADAVVAAALRARVPYLDVSAEQLTAIAVHERWAEAAQAAGVAVVPAMAFFGGLGDLLATAALGDWPDADEIALAVGLDRWQPTEGTRRTDTPRRVVVAGGQLVPVAEPAPTRRWPFPPPFGEQDVVSVPMSEIILIARHLRVRDVQSFINLAPLADLRDATMPPPVAVDDRGRSAQQFVVEAVARRGGQARRLRARGQDIYAITAPLVCEAAARILDGRSARTGVAAPGALFDPRDFLAALAPDLTIEDVA